MLLWWCGIMFGVCCFICVLVVVRVRFFYFFK